MIPSVLKINFVNAVMAIVIGGELNHIVCHIRTSCWCYIFNVSLPKTAYVGGVQYLYCNTSIFSYFTEPVQSSSHTQSACVRFILILPLIPQMDISF